MGKDELDDSQRTIHLCFFILYIIVGTLAVPMQIRLFWVILRSRSLFRIPAYRFVLHAAVADAVNMVMQTAVAALTIGYREMDPLLNKIVGGLFQASWAVEYPMILILSLNRLVAILFPEHLESIFGKRPTTAMISGCWLFGGFNLFLCLHPTAATLWDTELPGFYFTGGTFFSDVLFYMDFYFAEFIVCASLVCYLVILVAIIYKMRGGQMGQVKPELPLLSNFFVVFALTGVVLYLWHRPPSNSPLYGHLFNLAVMVRFGFASLFGLVSNRTIRTRFMSASRSSQGAEQSRNRIVSMVAVSTVVTM